MCVYGQCSYIEAVWEQGAFNTTRSPIRAECEQRPIVNRRGNGYRENESRFLGPLLLLCITKETHVVPYNSL